MIKPLGITLALGASLMALSQNTPPADLPTNLRAPEGEELILLARASGSQIYVCQVGTDQKLSWAFKAPEAELHDAQGTLIGSHFAGPTWKHNDGSQVTGAVTARQDAPDSKSIPWLLLHATGHSGNGILSRVTTIQRVHTNGGQPPNAAECGETARGKEVKSPYTADYYFYAPHAKDSH
jgi:Protein of unknown function (DUF3455)